MFVQHFLMLSFIAQDEAAAGVGGQWAGRAPLPRHPRRRHPPRLLGLRVRPAAAAGAGTAAQPGARHPQPERGRGDAAHRGRGEQDRASNEGSRKFHNHPTRTFSWMKVPTFKFKTQHYA